MNSNQFLTLLQKGNDLQKEDFQQLVKLHASFPYFQIPAVLAAKYENKNSKDGSTELLHKAAILSPNRAWLRSLIENNIEFLAEEQTLDPAEGNLASPSVVIIDSLKESDLSETIDQENASNSPSDDKLEDENINKHYSQTAEEENETEKNRNISTPSSSEQAETLATDLSSKEFDNNNAHTEEKIQADASSSSSAENSEHEVNNNDRPDLITSSHPTENTSPPLITSPSGDDGSTKPDLILPDSVEEPYNNTTTEEAPKPELKKPEEGAENKPIIEPVRTPPSSRQDILKQLEDNLARLKLESSRNNPVEEDQEEPKPSKPRRKRSGEDLIDSIKKKEKREIKDTKKKEQNDIIKAFNKKSIKMAAIKENEDVNKLQDLSLPSTKINDRMVSESYAKLLTQQGKKAAAKEIYKKLILKFPQKKAYFADLIQQLEE